MVIDVLFVVSMLYGFYLGFSKGIIKTIFNILSIFIGLVTMTRFSSATTEFLQTAFNDNNPLWMIAGWIITFVATMMLIRLFARGLEGILESVNINIINQVVGGMFMAGIFVLFYSGAVWAFEKVNGIDLKTKKESITYVYLEQYPELVRGVADNFKPIFVDFWHDTMEMMDKMERMSIERSESKPDIYDIEEEE